MRDEADDELDEGRGPRSRRRVLIVLAGLAAVGIIVAVTAVVVRATSNSSSACAQVADLRQREHDTNAAYHTTVVDTSPTSVQPPVTPLLINGKLVYPDTGPRFVSVGSLQDWREAYTVLAIAAEQNPSCFTVTERAQLEAGYRQLQAKP
jgi:hypothetical protein